MKNVKLIANFKVHLGRSTEFKTPANRCIDLVAEKEPDSMEYRWFFNAEETPCVAL